jgi:hypothetical protein
VRRRLLSFAAFFGVLSSLVALAHYYLWHRLLETPAWGEGLQHAGGIAFAALAVGTPAGLIAARALPRERSRTVAVAAYSWFGLLFMLLMALGVAELIRLAASPWVAEPQLSRMLAGLVGGSVAVAAAAGMTSALGRVGVKHVPITLERLPSELSGFRLVQLSDLHIGPMLGREWLERVVETVNELKPDAVAITGDLVDGSVTRLREHVAPLAALSAKHGVFFVTGNHEYYSGADEWLAELRRLGVRPLRNERVALGGPEASFDLAGVDDWMAFGDGHGANLASALEGRDPSRELVLLAHQPKQIDEASAYGVGLQLSGHTHGGQIFPWGVFVRLQQPYVSGLVRHGSCQLYVSNGTGFWGPPIRVGAPPEITLLELRPTP